MVLLKFEIVNPHDPYVMEAESFEVACVSMLLLAEGNYGLTSLDEPKGKDMPVMVFWDDVGFNKWSQEEFGKSMDQMLEQIDRDKVHCERVVSALETIRLTSGERTSMTALIPYAKRLAQGLRNKVKQMESAGNENVSNA